MKQLTLTLIGLIGFTQLASATTGMGFLMVNSLNQAVSVASYENHGITWENLPTTLPHDAYTRFDFHIQNSGISSVTYKIDCNDGAADLIKLMIATGPQSNIILAATAPANSQRTRLLSSDNLNVLSVKLVPVGHLHCSFIDPSQFNQELLYQTNNHLAIHTIGLG